MLGYQGRRLTAGAARHLLLPCSELCSPVCRDKISLPGAARGSFSLVLLQQTSPLRKMRSVHRGGEDVIFKEILGSLMKLLFQAS